MCDMYAYCFYVYTTYYPSKMCLPHTLRDPEFNIPLALQGILKAHSRLEQRLLNDMNHTVVAQ